MYVINLPFDIFNINYIPNLKVPDRLTFDKRKNAYLIYDFLVYTII